MKHDQVSSSVLLHLQQDMSVCILCVCEVNLLAVLVPDIRTAVKITLL